MKTLIGRILLFVFLAIVVFWVGCFIYFHDFSVPTLSINSYKKILVVFAHPDDELLGVGGSMLMNKRTTLLILTKGERGTPDAHLDNNLKNIRTSEELLSSRILGVQKLIQKDFGDNALQNKKDEIKKEITGVIKSEQPDLIVTFDESGFTGHPDHIAVSEVVTELVKTQFKSTQLWYASVPKKIYNFIVPPKSLISDTNYHKKRSYPSHKIFVGGTIFNKLLATLAHKSQYKLWEEGFPIPVPSAFFDSMTIFEYFYKAN